jgi:HEPN domain-containing protein
VITSSTRSSGKGCCLPRKTDSNNPGDWLAMAESDLQGVRALTERELSYHLCRSKLAEVLEKVLKAELIRLGWYLQKTHDLEKLAGELVSLKSDLVAQAKTLCTTLAEVYFSDRYPGFDLDDPDWPDLRAKLAQVMALLEKVKARIAKAPHQTGS